MRKALNDNPAVAMAVVAVLGLFVAFMLLHAISARSPGSATTDTTAATATTATAGVAVTGTAPTTAPTAGVPATTGVPATATPAASGTVAPAAAAIGAFKAGPGLPKALVDAYQSNKVVALVVLKRNGIDDHAMAAATAPLRHAPNVALFEVFASKVAQYARVAEGVDLNRVPAIVVLRPKSLTQGAVPQASVSYGFKSLQSVAQALRDASYKGPQNLPSYPR